jgi:hypothetical protein
MPAVHVVRDQHSTLLSAAPKESMSSAELVNGSQLILPARTGSSVWQRAAAARSVSILRGSRQHDAGTFSPGRLHVRASWQPAEAPYAGPYLVVFKGAKTFTIQVGQISDPGQVELIHGTTI